MLEATVAQHQESRDKVDLRGTKVTDADLEILKGLTQLRSLERPAPHPEYAPNSG